MKIPKLNVTEIRPGGAALILRDVGQTWNQQSLWRLLERAWKNDLWSALEGGPCVIISYEINLITAFTVYGSLYADGHFIICTRAPVIPCPPQIRLLTNADLNEISISMK